jgi:hypothetical protein
VKCPSRRKKALEIGIKRIGKIKNTFKSPLLVERGFRGEAIL